MALKKLYEQAIGSRAAVDKKKAKKTNLEYKWQLFPHQNVLRRKPRKSSSQPHLLNLAKQIE